MKRNEPLLLIGLNVKVCEATNSLQCGLEGIAIGETMKTVLIHTQIGDKVIPKKGTKFIVEMPSGRKVEILGDRIMNRPEELVRRDC